MHRRIWLTAALVVFLTACASPAHSSTGSPNNSSDVQTRVAQILTATYATASTLVTAAGSATPTPTLTETSTPTPTATATITPSPAPTTVPDGVVNIVLIGTDWREGQGARSDVMMLVSIHKLEGTVSVVSFPRDLYVDIPNHGMDRINVAKGYTGYDGLFDTFEKNFLVRPDHYMSTNMQGFTSMINILGGIDVYVGQSIQDRCDLPQARQGYCSYAVGTAHMDAKTALWYVRSRATSSDLDRLRREQEVLKGMLLKLLSMNAVERAPELYTTFSNSVETDLKVEDILALAPVAAQLVELEPHPALRDWYRSGHPHPHGHGCGGAHARPACHSRDGTPGGVRAVGVQRCS